MCMCVSLSMYHLFSPDRHKGTHPLTQTQDTDTETGIGTLSKNCIFHLVVQTCSTQSTPSKTLNLSISVSYYVCGGCKCFFTSQEVLVSYRRLDFSSNDLFEDIHFWEQYNKITNKMHSSTNKPVAGHGRANGLN